MVVTSKNVHETLGKYMLVDGFDLVLDLQKSQGCKIYDSRNDKLLLDGFSFFASAPLGYNHPSLNNSDFIKKIGTAALNKPTNSDIYTTEFASFVETFGKIAVPDFFHHLFFIEGGALAVENGLKTAFDWKIRKNFEQGRKDQIGTKVIHFKEAFHGRTGYTLTLTNTFNKNKVKYFPKFDWPRITNPKITFPLNDHNLKDVKEREKQAISEIDKAISVNPNDIAVLIIEPIQGEGGDNHFRKEFFKELQTICNDHEILFMVDEVQSGVGLTGRMWAYEHFDVKPDIVAFGKKTQVCGIMVGGRVDEIKDNVFKVPGRINSTWGGNLVDMIRAQKYFEIIKDENLIANAEKQGKRLQKGLHNLGNSYPELISNTRGKGLMCAFDLGTSEKRDQMRQELYDNGLLILGCGEKTIRFRPPLIINETEIDQIIEIIDKTIKEL